jgi:hypothetical protein
MYVYSLDKGLSMHVHCSERRVLMHLATSSERHGLSIFIHSIRLS